MKNPFIREGLYALFGGAAGMLVCFAVGMLIVWLFGAPPSGYFGIGLDRWSLPGTILGGVVFWTVAFWLPARINRKD